MRAVLAYENCKNSATLVLALRQFFEKKTDAAPPFRELIYSLRQQYRYCVSEILANSLANIFPNGQFMSAITQRHK